MSARRSDPVPPPDEVTEHNRLLSEAWALIANAYGGDWKRASDEWQVAATRWHEGFDTYSLNKWVAEHLPRCALCGSEESPQTLCLSCAGGGPMRTVTVLLQILSARPNRIADLAVAPAVGVVVSHPTHGRGVIAESDEVGAFSVIWLTGERAMYSLRRTGGADEKTVSNGKA